MRPIRNLIGILALSALAACELATDLDYSKVRCESGRTQCDGQCWDLQTSAQNCGACGHSCLGYGVCANGICVCASSTTDCGQGCTQTYSDPNNCGTCGHKCSPAEYCNAGVCTQLCGNYGYYYTNCSGQCVDTASDPMNCGYCNHTCASGQCAYGGCVVPDAGPDAACDPDVGAGVVIAGNLIVYDPLFSQTPPPAYAGNAQITMQGASCDWVQTSYDANAPLDDAGKNYFHLGNVKPDSLAWAHIYQTAGGTENVYPTLIPVNAIADLTIDDGFGFVSSTEIDKIYAALAVTRNPSKGTLLAQLLEPTTKTPIAGGNLSSSLGGTPAYAASGGWSPSGPTDATGVVVILNLDAPAFPGAAHSFHAATSTLSQDFDCVLEAGSVTICWLGLGP